MKERIQAELCSAAHSMYYIIKLSIIVAKHLFIHPYKWVRRKVIDEIITWLKIDD